MKIGEVKAQIRIGCIDLVDEKSTTPKLLIVFVKTLCMERGQGKIDKKALSRNMTRG